MQHGSCLLLAGLLWLTGCSGFVVISNGRVLAFVSVNPTNADPVNFPNAVVPFTAQGTVNSPPAVINPLPNVIWTVDQAAFNGGVPTSTHASIDQNGNAQCAAGFLGTVRVFATAPLDTTQPVSPTNQVIGVAQMICP